jgi:hypothetical protein
LRTCVQPGRSAPPSMPIGSPVPPSSRTYGRDARGRGHPRHAGSAATSGESKRRCQRAGPEWPVPTRSATRKDPIRRRSAAATSLAGPTSPSSPPWKRPPRSSLATSRRERPTSPSPPRPRRADLDDFVTAHRAATRAQFEQLATDVFPRFRGSQGRSTRGSSPQVRLAHVGGSDADVLARTHV